MPSQETPIGFHHSAGAYGVSGKFLWPLQETIAVRPSCDLPPTGGYSRIRHEGYSLEGLLSFKYAYTEVSGSPNEEKIKGTDKTVRAANNLSLSVIEGFNLLDIVTIDRIVSRITTRYFEFSDDIEIVLVGTRYEGFRISGQIVDIQLATDIHLHHATHGRLKSAIAEEGAVRERLQRLQGDEPLMFSDDGTLNTTIVETIHIAGRNDGIAVRGNMIDIDHVGQFHLGELTVSPNYKSLNMVRWTLGCPAGGDGSAGGGQGGGVRVPPGQ